MWGVLKDRGKFKISWKNSAECTPNQFSEHAHRRHICTLYRWCWCCCCFISAALKAQVLEYFSCLAGAYFSSEFTDSFISSTCIFAVTCCHPFAFQKDVELKSKHLSMALDDSQIVVQSFAAGKELIKRGSLSADDKAILGSYPQETYHHKDSPVLKQTSWWLMVGSFWIEHLWHFVHIYDICCDTGRKRWKQRRRVQPALLRNQDKEPRRFHRNSPEKQCFLAKFNRCV